MIRALFMVAVSALVGPSGATSAGSVANSSAIAAVVAVDTLPWAAIVDSAYKGAAGAPSAVGIPMFRTIGDALSQQPANGGMQTVIYIRNGRYREKLTIDRPRVTLRGESRNGVELTYDASADMQSPGGGTFGASGSYTLRIVAPDFRAEHLTIENTYAPAANEAKLAKEPVSTRHPQGGAVVTDVGNDRAVFDDVRILGHHNTLFANSGRAWFHACEISGTVDIISGAGQSVFEACDIVSRDRGSGTNNGYVTAPSTAESQPYGLLFLYSRLKKERAEMAAGSVALGRPWHPFADPQAVGSAVFVACDMEDHIGANGWEGMSSMDSTGTRIWYDPESARFFEYGSTGAGALPSASRRVLTKREMQRYTRMNVFSGWNPRPLPETRHADATAANHRGKTPSNSNGWVVDQAALSDRGGVSRVEELFEGRFPGVTVLRRSGGFSVQIRGATTINGSSAPLYVIDGFAIEAGPDGLISLNPGDVARIEVLKDATQLAMFGVRASNGVVVITTKRPE